MTHPGMQSKKKSLPRSSEGDELKISDIGCPRSPKSWQRTLNPTSRPEGGRCLRHSLSSTERWVSPSCIGSGELETTLVLEGLSVGAGQQGPSRQGVRSLLVEILQPVIYFTDYSYHFIQLIRQIQRKQLVLDSRG